VLYFTFAKVYFMAAGYAVTFGLPFAFRQDGIGAGLDPAAAADQARVLYGDFGFVNMAVSVLNMILIDGTRYTVSQFVARDDSNAAAVRRTAMLLQALVGGLLTLGYLLAAPLLADFFNRPELVNAFRLSAIIPLCYTFYAVCRGYLNGLRRFFAEAAFDVSFSTLKPTAMLSMAFLGFGVAGVMGGFGAAALVITLVALWITRGGDAHAPARAGDLWRYELRIMVYTALFYLLINCDYFLIGRLLTGEAGRQAAGDYYAELSLARIVWQGTFAITVVIFPLVSKVVAQGDPERTRAYVSQALRFTLIVAGFLAVVFSANAPAVLAIIFPKGFATDATPLRFLAFAQLSFALLMICTTVVSGSGRPTVSVVLVAIALGASFVLNRLAIPHWGLLGAAVATLLAVGAGAGIGMAYVWRRFSARIPTGSALRVLGIMAVCWAVSYPLDLDGKLLDLAECVGLGVLYLALVFVTRELTPREILALRRG